MLPKCFVIAAMFIFAVSGLSEEDNALGFTAKKEMIFPSHYREWIWLSSGLGMTYDANAQANPNPSFDNVFVSPQAYRAFVGTGAWPNGTVFILESRASHNQGSINLAGHYQGGIKAIEAHVKKADGAWAFYGFGTETKPAGAIPRSASCYSCHEQHGAVDTTFVQFYPTLLTVAQEKKTVNEKAFDGK